MNDTPSTYNDAHPLLYFKTLISPFYSPVPHVQTDGILNHAHSHYNTIFDFTTIFPTTALYYIDYLQTSIEVTSTTRYQTPLLLLLSRCEDPILCVNLINIFIELNIYSVEILNSYLAYFEATHEITKLSYNTSLPCSSHSVDLLTQQLPTLLDAITQSITNHHTLESTQPPPFSTPSFTITLSAFLAATTQTKSPYATLYYLFSCISPRFYSPSTISLLTNTPTNHSIWHSLQSNPFLQANSAQYQLFTWWLVQCIEAPLPPHCHTFTAHPLLCATLLQAFISINTHILPVLQRPDILSLCLTQGTAETKEIIDFFTTTDTLTMSPIPLSLWLLDFNGKTHFPSDDICPADPSEYIDISSKLPRLQEALLFLSNQLTHNSAFQNRIVFDIVGGMDVEINILFEENESSPPPLPTPLSSLPTLLSSKPILAILHANLLTMLHHLLPAILHNTGPQRKHKVLHTLSHFHLRFLIPVLLSLTCFTPTQRATLIATLLSYAAHLPHIFATLYQLTSPQTRLSLLLPLSQQFIPQSIPSHAHADEESTDDAKDPQQRVDGDENDGNLSIKSVKFMKNTSKAYTYINVLQESQQIKGFHTITEFSPSLYIEFLSSSLVLHPTLLSAQMHVLFQFLIEVPTRPQTFNPSDHRKLYTHTDAFTLLVLYQALSSLTCQLHSPHNMLSLEKCHSDFTQSEESPLQTYSTVPLDLDVVFQVVDTRAESHIKCHNPTISLLDNGGNNIIIHSTNNMSFNSSFDDDGFEVVEHNLNASDLTPSNRTPTIDYLSPGTFVYNHFLAHSLTPHNIEEQFTTLHPLFSIKPLICTDTYASPSKEYDMKSENSHNDLPLVPDPKRSNGDVNIKREIDGYDNAQKDDCLNRSDDYLALVMDLPDLCQGSGMNHFVKHIQGYERTKFDRDNDGNDDDDMSEEQRNEIKSRFKENNVTTVDHDTTLTPVMLTDMKHSTSTQFSLYHYFYPHFQQPTLSFHLTLYNTLYFDPKHLMMLFTVSIMPSMMQLLEWDRTLENNQSYQSDIKIVAKYHNTSRISNIPREYSQFLTDFIFETSHIDPFQPLSAQDCDFLNATAHPSLSSVLNRSTLLHLTIVFIHQYALLHTVAQSDSIFINHISAHHFFAQFSPISTLTSIAHIDSIISSVEFQNNTPDITNIALTLSLDDKQIIESTADLFQPVNLTDTSHISTDNTFLDSWYHSVIFKSPNFRNEIITALPSFSISPTVHSKITYPLAPINISDRYNPPKTSITIDKPGNCLINLRSIGLNILVIFHKINPAAISRVMAENTTLYAFTQGIGFLFWSYFTGILRVLSYLYYYSLDYTPHVKTNLKWDDHNVFPLTKKIFTTQTILTHFPITTHLAMVTLPLYIIHLHKLSLPQEKPAEPIKEDIDHQDDMNRNHEKLSINRPVPTTPISTISFYFDYTFNLITAGPVKYLYSLENAEIYYNDVNFRNFITLNHPIVSFVDIYRARLIAMTIQYFKFNPNHVFFTYYSPLSQLKSSTYRPVSEIMIEKPPHHDNLTTSNDKYLLSIIKVLLNPQNTSNFYFATPLFYLLLPHTSFVPVQHSGQILITHGAEPFIKIFQTHLALLQTQFIAFQNRVDVNGTNSVTNIVSQSCPLLYHLPITPFGYDTDLITVPQSLSRKCPELFSTLLSSPTKEYEIILSSINKSNINACKQYSITLDVAAEIEEINQGSLTENDNSSDNIPTPNQFLPYYNITQMPYDVILSVTAKIHLYSTLIQTLNTPKSYDIIQKALVCSFITNIALKHPILTHFTVTSYAMASWVYFVQKHAESHFAAADVRRLKDYRSEQIQLAGGQETLSNEEYRAEINSEVNVKAEGQYDHQNYDENENGYYDHDQYDHSLYQSDQSGFYDYYGTWHPYQNYSHTQPQQHPIYDVYHRNKYFDDEVDKVNHNYPILLHKVDDIFTKKPLVMLHFDNNNTLISNDKVKKEQIKAEEQSFEFIVLDSDDDDDDYENDRTNTSASDISTKLDLSEMNIKDEQIHLNVATSFNSAPNALLMPTMGDKDDEQSSLQQNNISLVNMANNPLIKTIKGDIFTLQTHHIVPIYIDCDDIEGTKANSTPSSISSKTITTTSNIIKSSKYLQLTMPRQETIAFAKQQEIFALRSERKAIRAEDYQKWDQLQENYQNLSDHWDVSLHGMAPRIKDEHDLIKHEPTFGSSIAQINDLNGISTAVPTPPQPVSSRPTIAISTQDTTKPIRPMALLHNINDQFSSQYLPISHKSTIATSFLSSYYFGSLAKTDNKINLMILNLTNTIQYSLLLLPNYFHLYIATYLSYSFARTTSLFNTASLKSLANFSLKCISFINRMKKEDPLVIARYTQQREPSPFVSCSGSSIITAKTSHILNYLRVVDGCQKVQKQVKFIKSYLSFVSDLQLIPYCTSSFFYTASYSPLSTVSFFLSNMHDNPYANRILSEHVHEVFIYPAVAYFYHSSRYATYLSRVIEAADTSASRARLKDLENEEKENSLFTEFLPIYQRFNQHNTHSTVISTPNIDYLEAFPFLYKREPYQRFTFNISNVRHDMVKHVLSPKYPLHQIFSLFDLTLPAPTQKQFDDHLRLSQPKSLYVYRHQYGNQLLPPKPKYMTKEAISQSLKVIQKSHCLYHFSLLLHKRKKPGIAPWLLMGSTIYTAAIAYWRSFYNEKILETYYQIICRKLNIKLIDNVEYKRSSRHNYHKRALYNVENPEHLQQHPPQHENKDQGLNLLQPPAPPQIENQTILSNQMATMMSNPHMSRMMMPTTNAAATLTVPHQPQSHMGMSTLQFPPSTLILPPIVPLFAPGSLPQQVRPQSGAPYSFAVPQPQYAIQCAPPPNHMRAHLESLYMQISQSLQSALLHGVYPTDPHYVHLQQQLIQVSGALTHLNMTATLPPSQLIIPPGQQTTVPIVTLPLHPPPSTYNQIPMNTSNLVLPLPPTQVRRSTLDLTMSENPAAPTTTADIISMQYNRAQSLARESEKKTMTKIKEIAKRTQQTAVLTQSHSQQENPKNLFYNNKYGDHTAHKKGKTHQKANKKY